MGLQTLINERISKPTLIRVLTIRGARFELAAIRALPVVAKLKPARIILLAGVCDLTFRDRRTKITELRHSTVKANVDQVLSAAKAAWDVLTAVGTHVVVFATVTGIELNDYNDPQRKFMDAATYKKYNLTKAHHPRQALLNSSILEINRQLVQLNKANSVPTVWLAGIVHSRFKKAIHHYYIRLFDGCHPDNRTKAAWAELLVKYIRKATTGTE